MWSVLGYRYRSLLTRAFVLWLQLVATMWQSRHRISRSTFLKMKPESIFLLCQLIQNQQTPFIG